MANINDNIPKGLKILEGKINYIVIGIILISVIFSGIFQLSPEEVGVITQFGKYNRTVEPGLHFKIPFIEKIYKVAVERQQKLEFGFRTERAGIKTVYSNLNYSAESLMLTGDLNLADVEWVVQYRISNPYNFLFKVRNPNTTLRDISESAIREIVGDRTVNEALTVGRTEISSKLEELMQKLCTEYSLGINIDQIVLQGVNPPESVKEAFNAVNEAQQEKETLINKAKSEYNKVIPKASGEAQETIQKAEGYAMERVNNATGEVARFVALYKEYIKAPEVTRSRIYFETMGKVIPKLGTKIITDPQGNNVLPLLQMKMNEKTQNVQNVQK